MRRVHVVEKYHSHAMIRHTIPFQQLHGVKVTVGDEIDHTADLNIHMPWHYLANEEPQGKSKHVACFTHENPGNAASIYQAGKRADIMTCLSFQARERLIELGVDSAKIRVAYVGTDHMHYRRRNIGIVASKQPNGRKRMNILMDLAWKMDQSWLMMLQFIIVGMGWEQEVKELRNAGLNVDYVDRVDDDEKMVQLYHNFDLLISTAHVEGGPLPVIEAMKAGVPVLTPDYGYPHDLCADIDKYDSVEELIDKIEKRFQHVMDNVRIASQMTWAGYAQEYALIIQELLGVPVKVSDDDGTPRYGALRKVVNAVQPRNILEVGTWNG